MFTVGILTISDKGYKGEREDLSGAAIREFVEKQGWVVKQQHIVPDELLKIKTQLKRMVDKYHCDLILTTGGTGFSPRDITPEATKAVIEREVPGLAEYMRAESVKKIATALLSRAVCGIRGQSLIVNLPGSPRGVKENLEFILPVLPHGLAKLKGDTEECAIK
jgi:molybdopterin adenylyltransferase